MAGKQQNRTREAAQLARAAVKASPGMAVVLPGKVGDKGALSEVDWESCPVAALIPYRDQLVEGDVEGERRRETMDSMVKGVMRYGEPSLLSVAAALASTSETPESYSLPVIERWWVQDVDDFATRVQLAHKVFKGRFVMAVVDRADKPYVPREHFRDNLPLFGVLNAFVSEHFKRNASVNITTAADSIKFSKTLIQVGEQMEAGIAAAQTTKILPDQPDPRGRGKNGR